MKTMFTLENNQLILRAAAIYSVISGVLVTVIPTVILSFFGVDIPSGLEFWHLFGMLMPVIGLGYFIAGQDTSKYWPIVLVGLLGNMMGAFVFAKALLTGSLPVYFSGFLLVSTAFWIIPFYFILKATFDELIEEDSPPKQFGDLVRFVRTSQNKTLLDLSKQQNVLLVFVRHFGCTFCRETVAEMSKIDEIIKGKHLTVVFVHMSDPSYGDEFFARYYDHPVHHISDPGRALYKSLNLRRGSFYQLFGPATWIRGVNAGLIKGHGRPREFEGDSMQLGGVFILSHGQIIYEQKAKTASHLFQINTLPEI